MPLVKMAGEQAALQFMEGMREVAAAATRYRDEALFAALLKMARAAASQGVLLEPQGGLFAPCPVCDAWPGQSCINVPGHLLHDDFHPERVELAAKVLAGEVPPP
ncbi:zinc finger domain-containing protein [Micromonospora citrea]|uniref:zinc finger domain-containing protein n=1 Tax=Micromonospora citrea TaxID=47855 RepID=UPI003C44C462